MSYCYVALVCCVSNSWYRTSVHGKSDIAAYVVHCVDQGHYCRRASCITAHICTVN
jgi:hypothetical protein